MEVIGMAEMPWCGAEIVDDRDWGLCCMRRMGRDGKGQERAGRIGEDGKGRERTGRGRE